MSGFSIELPYSVYSVPLGRRTFVNLSKNSQLRGAYGEGQQYLLTRAKDQVRVDTEKLMVLAYWGKDLALPLRLDVTVTNCTRRKRDDDGLWVALYVARDTIARALPCDDNDMLCGEVTWVVGQPERTLIAVKGKE